MSSMVSRVTWDRTPACELQCPWSADSRQLGAPVRSDVDHRGRPSLRRARRSISVFPVTCTVKHKAREWYSKSQLYLFTVVNSTTLSGFLSISCQTIHRISQARLSGQDFHCHNSSFIVTLVTKLPVNTKIYTCRLIKLAWTGSKTTQKNITKKNN